MYLISLRQLKIIQDKLKQYIEYAQKYNENGEQKESIPKENVVNLLNNMIMEILHDL